MKCFIEYSGRDSLKLLISWQPAEQRKGMDAIDKFAKSKARYPLLGMHLNDILIFGHTHRPYNDIQNNVVNTGAWIADMLVPKWFEEEYGQDKACFGWYIERTMVNTSYYHMGSIKRRRQNGRILNRTNKKMRVKKEKKKKILLASERSSRRGGKTNGRSRKRCCETRFFNSIQMIRKAVLTDEINLL